MQPGVCTWIPCEPKIRLQTPLNTKFPDSASTLVSSVRVDIANIAILDTQLWQWEEKPQPPAF